MHDGGGSVVSESYSHKVLSAVGYGHFPPENFGTKVTCICEFEDSEDFNYIIRRIHCSISIFFKYAIFHLGFGNPRSSFALP